MLNPLPNALKALISISSTNLDLSLLPFSLPTFIDNSSYLSFNKSVSLVLSPELTTVILVDRMGKIFIFVSLGLQNKKFQLSVVN